MQLINLFVTHLSNLRHHDTLLDTLPRLSWLLILNVNLFESLRALHCPSSNLGK